MPQPFGPVNSTSRADTSSRLRTDRSFVGGSGDLDLGLALTLRNVAAHASDLEPSAAIFSVGVPVASWRREGVLSEPIEYIKHSGHAHTADCT